MKVEFLSFENFANYAKVEVNFDDNITYLIGKNGAGKSTIGLNGLWFMFQGIAEKSSGGNNPLIGERFRFIGPNGASAKGKMILHDEKTGNRIIVSRKMTKSGTELTFDGPEGMDLTQNWLNELFNIFLIAPKRFMGLSPKQQAEALGIDTTEFDEKMISIKGEYSSINAVVKGFGNIVEVEKVDPVDFTALSKEKDEIINFNSLQDERQRDIDQTNYFIENVQLSEKSCNDEIDKLKKQIADLELKREGYLLKLKTALNERDNLPQPEQHKSVDDIQTQIDNATTTNTKAQNYKTFLERRTAKEAREKELNENKKKQNKLEADRIDYIKTFKFPFSNITVNDDGEILLGGKPINDTYFSTGEYLKIVPILIATTQPEMKYVFLQDYNLLDDDKKTDVIDYLIGKGFQLVIEMVGTEKIIDKNCILLKDNVIVDNYDEQEKEPALTV